jgi:VanZ family protein
VGKKRFNKYLKYWFPVILWIGFIFFMSTATFSAQNTSSIFEPVLRFFMPSISLKQIDIAHGIIRKFAHITEYFISGILLFRAFRSDADEQWTWRWVFLSLLIVVLIAASDEYHQSFVPVRTASLVDVCIDTLGGMLALCVDILKYHRRSVRSDVRVHQTGSVQDR